jgi:hypothetical protein
MMKAAEHVGKISVYTFPEKYSVVYVRINHHESFTKKENSTIRISLNHVIYLDGYFMIDNSGVITNIPVKCLKLEIFCFMEQLLDTRTACKLFYHLHAMRALKLVSHG